MVAARVDVLVPARPAPLAVVGRPGRRPPPAGVAARRGAPLPARGAGVAARDRGRRGGRGQPGPLLNAGGQRSAAGLWTTACSALSCSRNLPLPLGASAAAGGAEGAAAAAAPAGCAPAWRQSRSPSFAAAAGSAVPSPIRAIRPR